MRLRLCKISKVQTSSVSLRQNGGDLGKSGSNQRRIPRLQRCMDQGSCFAIAPQAGHDLLAQGCAGYAESNVAYARLLAVGADCLANLRPYPVIA